MVTGQINETGSKTEVGSRRLFEIDPSHTIAEFAVKHMMISTVKGRLARVAGTIELDEANPLNSRVEAVAEVASIDTGDAQRDAHLRSADFFDADNHPTLEVRSNRILALGDDGKYRVAANLTIRGVTREVVFEVSYFGLAKDPWGNTRLGLSATASISRKDFGLNWNVALEAGGFLVGDTVKMTLEVEAVKKVAA